MRYEKFSATYLTMVTITVILIWLHLCKHALARMLPSIVRAVFLLTDHAMVHLCSSHESLSDDP
jgi:hypothetical protein